MLRVEERIKKYQPYFGRWRLKEGEVLGRGTSGSVFTICDGPLEAALKVVPIPRDEGRLKELQSQFSSDEDVRRALREELELVKDEIGIMRRIWSESNIVCFEESVIIDRDDTYGWDVLIRMEKLIRVDHFLKGECARFGYSRDRDLIVRMWDELLSGLLVCEKNRIVHLDIKPENIFYAPGRDHFKLGDFGVSVRKESGRRVAENMIVGTLDYMAPEIRLGHGGDTRSDIYSLALMIYQLLNNDRLPFVPGMGAYTEDDRRRAVETRLEGKKPIPRLKGLNGPLMDVLLRCMEFLPENRYQTVESAQSDLRKIIYGGQIDDDDGGGHRSKLLPILIAVASLGLAGILVLLGLRASNSGTQSQPQPVETAYLETAAPTEALGNTVTANGGMLFASIEGGAVGYIDMTITGSVTLVAQINGQTAEVMRVSEAPEGVRAANWPQDGLCFVVPETEANRTLELSVACYAPDGAELYRWSDRGYWLKMASGASVFMQGEAPVITATPEPTPIATPEPTSALEPETTASRLDSVSILIDGSENADGIIELHDDSLEILWQTQGTAENYTIYIDNEEGTRLFEETDVAGTGYTFRTSKLTVGKVYTVTVGARPVGGSNEQIVWDSARFMIPVARETVTVDSPGYIHVSHDGNEYFAYHGSAEPGEKVVVYQGEVRMGVVSAQEDGYWEAVIPASDIRSDGVVAFSFGYEDDEKVAVQAFDMNDALDTLTLAEEVREGGSEVVGFTKPGATVTVLNADLGREYGSAVADENGRFTVYCGEATFAEGDVLRIDVTDGNGNAKYSETVVGALAEFAGISMIVIPDAVGQSEVFFAGSAEPEQTIVFSWGNASVVPVTVETDANGYFEAVIPAVASNGSDTSTMTVCYADPDRGSIALTIPRDDVCDLIVPETVRDGASTIEVRGEPDAYGQLEINGEKIVDFRFDGSGLYTLNLPEISVSDEVEILSSDGRGNVTRANIVVERGEYAQLRVEMDPVPMNDGLMPAGIGEGLTVRIYGEPGVAVKETITNAAGGQQTETVTLDDDGYCGFRYSTLPEDEYTFRFEYVDHPEQSCEIAFRVDLTAPSIAVEGADMAGVQSLTIRTEPGVYLQMEHDNEAFLNAVADENGVIVLESINYPAGDYRLIASDEAGNFSEKTFSLRERMAISVLGAADHNRDDGVVIIGGTAEPGMTIDVTVGGSSAGSITADESGAWRVSLPDSLFPETQNVEVGFAYADGQGAAAAKDVYLDTRCALTLDAAAEGATAFTGISEPDATVSLFEGDTLIGSATTGGDGRFELSLPEAAKPGQRFFVVAEDAFGNIAKVEIIIDEMVRRPITLFANPVMNVDYISGRDALTFFGHAESGHNLRIDLAFDGGVKAYSVALPGKAAAGSTEEYSLSIQPAEIFAGDTDVTVTVSYADGLAASCAQTMTLHYDCTAPSLYCDSAAIDDVTDRIVVNTEPGERVTLFVDGAAVGEAYAGADGTAAFDRDLIAGEAIVIRVSDLAGNTAEHSFTVEHRLPIAIGSLIVEEDAAPVLTTVRVRGWLAHAADQSVQYELRLECDGDAWIVPLSGMTAMSADEFNETYTPFSGAARADVGYWIDQEIAVGEELTVGSDCIVRLVVRNEGEELVFGGDSFAVEGKLPIAKGGLSVVDDSGAQGATVRVQGWLVYASDQSVRHELRLECDGIVWTVPINSTDVRTMSEADFEYAFAPYEGAVRADTGYWIDKAVEVDEELAVGSECYVQLSAEVGTERFTFDGDSFTVAAAEVVEVQANPVYVGESYAIGFDAVQPAKVYAPDDVLLTGWYYGSESNGFEIVSIECAPVNAPDDVITIDLSECDIEEMPSAPCVVVLPRDISGLYPADVPGQMPDIEADEDKPGFILYAELPIPDGDYIITLVTQVDGPYEKAASIRVTVDHRLDLLPSQLSQQLADSWNAPDGAPAITFDGAAPAGIVELSADSVQLSWAAEGEPESYSVVIESYDGTRYVDYVTSETGTGLTLSSLPSGELLILTVTASDATSIAHFMVAG